MQNQNPLDMMSCLRVYESALNHYAEESIIPDAIPYDISWEDSYDQSIKNASHYGKLKGLTIKEKKQEIKLMASIEKVQPIPKEEFVIPGVTRERSFILESAEESMKEFGQDTISQSNETGRVFNPNPSKEALEPFGGPTFIPTTPTNPLGETNLNPTLEQNNETGRVFNPSPSKEALEPFGGPTFIPTPSPDALREFGVEEASEQSITNMQPMTGSTGITPTPSNLMQDVTSTYKFIPNIGNGPYEEQLEDSLPRVR